MPPVGFEPTVSAGERPQIDALDRAATRTGIHTKLPCDNQLVSRIFIITQLIAGIGIWKLTVDS